MVIEIMQREREIQLLDLLSFPVKNLPPGSSLPFQGRDLYGHILREGGGPVASSYVAF